MLEDVAIIYANNTVGLYSTYTFTVDIVYNITKG